jgi:hypothetical protein
LLGRPISCFATKSCKIKRPLVYVIVLCVALAPCIGSEIAYAACTLDNIIVSIKDERRDTRLMDKMASGTLAFELSNALEDIYHTATAVLCENSRNKAGKWHKLVWRREILKKNKRNDVNNWNSYSISPLFICKFNDKRYWHNDILSVVSIYKARNVPRLGSSPTNQTLAQHPPPALSPCRFRSWTIRRPCIVLETLLNGKKTLIYVNFSTIFWKLVYFLIGKMENPLGR